MQTIELQFDFDWLASSSSPDSLSQQTMARLRIQAGDLCLTRVVDRRSRIYREEVVVPLFSLAEWIVANWWFLWYEPDVEVPELRRPGFDERHDLRFAGDGFYFPSITWSPRGDHVRVESKAWRPEHGSIEFLAGGTSPRFTPRASLETVFCGIVDAVLERLHSCGLSGDGIEEDWEAIQNLNADQFEFCRASALLGLDPFALDDVTAGAIERLWNEWTPSIREDILACSEPSALDAVATWVGNSLHRLNSVESGPAWASLRNRIGQPDGVFPWERGYDLARRARQCMGLDGGRFDFQGEWQVGVLTDETPRYVDALVASDRPSVLVALRTERGKRFLMARAVGEFLARSEDGPALLTQFKMDRQRQCRAFAAEFLAPAALIREALAKERSGDVDASDRVAEMFGVSTQVIQYQVRNQLPDFEMFLR